MPVDKKLTRLHETALSPGILRLAGERVTLDRNHVEWSKAVADAAYELAEVFLKKEEELRSSFPTQSVSEAILNFLRSNGPAKPGESRKEIEKGISSNAVDKSKVIYAAIGQLKSSGKIFRNASAGTYQIVSCGHPTCRDKSICQFPNTGSNGA